jgi:hypothetical protein
VPEDIREKATRFAGEYLAHDVSCERLYRDVVALLMAERLAQKERDAKVAQTFYNLTHGQQARVASMKISAAIRNQR